MGVFVKLGATAKESVLSKLLFVSISIAASSPLVSTAAFARSCQSVLGKKGRHAR
jgi:hypothetical protein